MSPLGSNVVGLNAEQREIAALLKDEFVELVDYAQSVFVDADDLAVVAQAADPQSQQDLQLHSQLQSQLQALETFSITLEHIASAVELAGLLGLADTCRHLHKNFSHLRRHPQLLQPKLRKLLQSWPSHLLHYLQHINHQETSMDVALQLLDGLSESTWPMPLDESQKQDILGRFQASHFSFDDDAGPTVPTLATVDMVSLETGDDARIELVESMLIELPRQTQELEASVNRYLKTQDIADLTLARRMAHTLKGSANIVGIQGIANLMHYSEDILEIVSKHPIEQVGALEELLLNVSDTLAMMTEYLTGVGPAPDDSLSVLQSVLDFTRELKATIGEEDGALQEQAPAQHATPGVKPEFDELDLPDVNLSDADDLSRLSIENDFSEECPPTFLTEATPDVEGVEIDEALLSNLAFCESSYTEEIPDDKPHNETNLDIALEGDEFIEGSYLDEELIAESFFTDNASSEIQNDELLDNALCGDLLPDDLLLDETLIDEQLTDEQRVDLQLLNEPQLDLELLGDEDLFATTDTDEASELDLIAEIDDFSAAPENVSEKDASAVSVATSQHAEIADDENADESHRLSVPLSTAQELLRIAGETQITNAQIEAQIAAMRANVKSTELYQLRLRNMANELESLVQTQNALRAASMKYADSEIDPIEMERYSELDTFSNQLVELTTDAHEAIAHVEEQLRELSTISYTQQQLNKDNQGTLLRLRMIPVEVMSSRFARCVRQAARLSRKTVEFSLEGERLLVDSMVLNRIVDPLLHLLRNAVDHGIETQEEERENAHKNSVGKVTLSFEQRGETLTIICRDDGQGLDYASIQEKAVAKGIISGDVLPSQQELEQLILLPGFSTRSSASQTSGRGIGLDAVVADVKALKGSMSIKSEPEQGCAFIITVPTSILTGHALLVRCSSRLESQVLSVVSRNIEQIVYVANEQLTKTADGLKMLHDDEDLSLYNINDLVNLYPEYNDTITAVLITRRPSGQKIGIGVEAVLASQDMVVKPLNKFVYHPPGIVGATILGDGTVSPVIDMQELPGVSMTTDEWERWRQQLAEANRLRDKSRDDIPLALIVDDSLSARRSLVQFVTDMGMEALTAKDGFEAINVVNERKPSIMLVDLEMPRMNGLELTSHLRSRADTRDIPVIMITSRTTEKHRTMAENAGVNTYLNKPWSEEELLECIEKELNLQI